MQKQKIFIVHPEPALIEPVLHHLRKDGHQLAMSNQTIGASAAILRELPDLLIIDMDRPIIDGVALVMLLRKNPRLLALPILLWSATMAVATLRAKAMEATANGYLTGTMVPERVVTEIYDFLARRRPHMPNNEAQRLKTLQRYNVLDTAAEQVYDDITRVASVVCETPMALVSLVDADRQWIKSRQGLDVSQTPREIAFCAHAINDPEIFEVRDASRDDRFARNPLVTGDPNIRFYAGAPLTGSDGTTAGTLCVIDRIPRTLTASQREVLAALGRIVTALLTGRAR
jgi:CheY-like chemotaxis protein